MSVTAREGFIKMILGEMTDPRHPPHRTKALHLLTQLGMTQKEAIALIDAHTPEGDAEGFKLDLVSFSTVTAKRTDWAWEGRIPRGMLTEAVGTEGLGKSALTLELAARVTLGKLPGVYAGEPSDVVLVTTEDDPQRTLRPRLDAAGADVVRVHYVKLTENGHDSGVMLPRDAGRIGRAMAEAKARLLIIDPLAGILDPRVNTYKDTDVRAALTPLVVAAQEDDFAVIGVRHTNKNKSTDARERAMGSVGYRQVVRSSLIVTVDPDDAEGKEGPGRIVAHDKCNVGKLQRSVRFSLDSVPVEIEGKPEDYVRAVLGEECHWRASDGLAAEAGISDEKLAGKGGIATEMLREMLADGPRAVEELKAEAQEREIGWRTVEAAKATLGLLSWKPKGANANVWGWGEDVAPVV